MRVPWGWRGDIITRNSLGIVIVNTDQMQKNKIVSVWILKHV